MNQSFQTAGYLLTSRQYIRRPTQTFMASKVSVWEVWKLRRSEILSAGSAAIAATARTPTWSARLPRPRPRTQNGKVAKLEKRMFDTYLVTDQCSTRDRPARFCSDPDFLFTAEI